MSLYNNTTSQPDESQESEFTAASTLACLAKNDGKNNNEHNGDDEEEDEEKQDFPIPQRFTKSGRKRAVPFTIKLMKVLSDKNNADIITWMPSGKSFNILKPKAFVADILPEHFKTAKYSSFTRKLHRWGFMRHYRGEEAGAFYHKDFQRGRLDLVEEMTCHKAEPPKFSEAMGAPKPLPKKSPAIAVKPVIVLRPTPVPAAKKTVMPTMTAASLVAPATPKVVPTLTQMPTPTSFRHPQSVTRTPTMMGPSLTSGLPPMAPSLSGNTHTTATPTLAALESERLNAAIEREVNRRLKERINAVALSRQAFAVSALRQQQLTSLSVPRPSQHSQHSRSSQWTALLMQKQAEMMKNHSSSAGARLPLNIAPTLGYRGMGNSEGQQSLPSAPPTNIQGARTA